jgi:hypothetical protein
MLEDIAAGRPVRRRDALMLPRMLHESAAIRAAESLLEASDTELLPRVVALLTEVFVPAAQASTRHPLRNILT